MPKASRLCENEGMLQAAPHSTSSHPNGSTGQVLPAFASLKHVHIIGVCGTLMGAFAAFLKRRGIRVTGSDQNIYPPMSDVLKNAGVELMSGFSAQNIAQFTTKPDLVVIGNVIPRANVEAIEALSGKYAFSSLPETMEKLMLQKTRNIVVCGTHGKTTTSSMMAFVLQYCGKKPSYFFGGVAQDLPQSFHVESMEAGEPFVIEGDEYDTAFWDKVPKFNHYLPDDAILTSVEFDHADIYADFGAVKKAFAGLIERLRPQGTLTACAEFPAVLELAATAKVPVTTYGLGANARFSAQMRTQEGGLTRFGIYDGEKEVDEIILQVPGNHNILNALAVWIETRRLNLDSERVRQAFAAYRGVKRRQEVRGEVRGVTVIDDFAHHPTAVRETLRALRGKYAGRRMVAIFEPRSATSRRKVFQKDFGDAFSEADQIFVASPYDQSKISADDQFKSEQLAEDLVARGRPAACFAEIDAGVDDVARAARSGDVLVVMSNGGFGGFIPKLLEKLAQ